MRDTHAAKPDMIAFCEGLHVIAGRRAVFFFNDTATTEIYTLSLHDALPISSVIWGTVGAAYDRRMHRPALSAASARSEEHTSELQSRPHIVCRLLLEKKKMRPCNPHVTNKRIAPCRIRIPRIAANLQAGRCR